MFTLPPLPYETDALEPHMSAETLSLHHGKHHKAYVDKLNDLIADTAHEGMTLEELIDATHAARSDEDRQIFNNAAQCWNHTFFWSSLTPEGRRAPGRGLSDAIDQAFGGFDEFAAEFKDKAVSHFGSGWAWLAMGASGLEITTTHDADPPHIHGKIALLACDLWEHAYYVDYRNERPAFVSAFLGHLANWDFATENFNQFRNGDLDSGTRTPAARLVA